MNPLRLSAAVSVLLAASFVIGAAGSSTVSDLRELLLQDAWSHDVRLGRVAVESRVLVFRESGEVIERIYDDTGVHDLAGTWSLEETDGTIVLVLAGEHLRDRGRFEVKRAPNDDAIELRWIGGERVLRFERRKGMSNRS